MRFILILTIFTLTQNITMAQDLKTCVTAQMDLLQANDYNYNRVYNHFHPEERGTENFQFDEKIDGCATRATYVKSGSEDRQVSYVELHLGEGVPVSFGNLNDLFGEFAELPPAPGGTWSAMIMGIPGEDDHEYTLLVQDSAPLTPETLVKSLIIRVD